MLIKSDVLALWVQIFYQQHEIDIICNLIIMFSIGVTVLLTTHCLIFQNLIEINSLQLGFERTSNKFQIQK